MAKQCKQCKKTYGDNLASCPHCAGKGSGSGTGGSSGDLNLKPKGHVKTRRLPDRGSEIPGYLGSTETPDGSEVDLGALHPREGTPKIILPGNSGAGSEVNLGSLSEHLAGGPKVVLPASIASVKQAAVPSPLLAQAGAAAKEPGEKVDPKATKIAKQQGEKTMLADEMDLDVAGEHAPPKPADPKATKIAKRAEATMLAEGMGSEPLDLPKANDPKATKIAKGESPKTMLAGIEGALPIPKTTQLAGGSGKPTQIAGPGGGAPATQLAGGAQKATQLAGAAQKATQLAPPDEMDAALSPEAKAKKTQMAAGVAPKTQLATAATPMTKLAKRDEQDMLRMPEKHQETQLASGATPMTKLAKRDEQDELRLDDPTAPPTPSDEFNPAEAATIEAPTQALMEEVPAEEETVASEVQEERAPVVVQAPAPRPRYFRRWVAGGFLGTLTGAAACLGLILYDVIDLDNVRKMVGMPVKAKPTIYAPASPQAQDLNAALALLEAGEFDKALKILDNLGDAASPEGLTKRGEARWLKHLKEKKEKKETPAAKDEPVVTAQKDLTAAKTAEADFWLGHIEEVVTGAPAGRKKYEAGVAKYKANPDQVRMFQSALDRLDSTAGDNAGAMLDNRNDDVVVRTPPWALLFLIALQDPDAPPPARGGGDAPPAAVDPHEAGADFWHAAKLARGGNYDKAIQALKAAQAVHEKRRYAMLGKTQNPTSDPEGLIFLRTCDELIHLFEYRKQAKLQGYPDVASAIKAAAGKDAAKTLAALVETLKKDADAAKDDPDVKDPAKALGALIAAKDATSKQLVDVKTALGDPKDLLEEAKKAKDNAAGLNEVAKLLTPDKFVTEDQPSPVKGVESLLKAKKERDDQFAALSAKFDVASATIKGIADRLVKRKHLDPKLADNPMGILAGVDKLIHDAESPVVNALAQLTAGLATAGRGPGSELGRNLDLSAALAASQVSNARYQALLGQSRSPDQMLDLWLPLLQDRDRKDVVAKAILDAKRVRGDKSAPQDLLAKASCVEGLALRNQGKDYDGARKALAAAITGAGDAPWRTYAVAGHAELTDPSAFYLPAAEAAQADRAYPAALNILDRGLEVFPDGKKSGRLLALRSIVTLDLARAAAKGIKLDKTNPQIKAAAKDARAALDAGAKGDAHYALGRIAEELGDRKTAEKNYRQALEIPTDRSSRNRYRLSLARILVRLPDVVPEEEKPEEKPAEKKPADKKDDDKEEDKKPAKKPADKKDDDKEEMKKDDEKKAADKKKDEKKDDKEEMKKDDDKKKDDKKKDDDKDDKKKDDKKKDDDKDDKKKDDKKKDDEKDDKKKDDDKDDKKKDDKKKDDDKDDKKKDDKDDKKKDDKDDKKKDDKDVGQRPSQLEFLPLGATVILGAAPVDDDEEDKPTPDLDEAIRLGEQAIKDGNPEGHLIKALALAKKGRWTEAVLEYSTGLEKLDKDPEHGKGLRYLMQNHPALRIPDGQMPADPLTAEKHFTLGLRLYWSRRNAEAEKEFFRAVQYNDHDARYMYFLGLARLNQGKQTFAVEAFRRGGMLEQQNRPASATISAMLERVQGPDRLLLNRYRP